MILKIPALLALLALNASAGEILVDPARETVAIPGGEGGVRLDDYYFDRTLNRLVVPAGRTGRLLFIDPKSSGVSSMVGFPAPAPSAGPVSGGLTSADGVGGVIFTTDRTDRALYVVDGRKRAIIARSALASGPDYVRYVAPTKEIWVTEPKDKRIEIFSLAPSTGQFTVPVSSEFITSKDDEFEALAVDPARGRAYSNQGDKTVAIDLKTREIVATWPNSCKSGEGLALDAERGYLVVACREGMAVVLDVGREGNVLSSLPFGDGIDIIALAPETSRLFLPGAKSGTMAFVALSNEGKLTLLGQAETAKGAHCVATDNAGAAWVCDPNAGRLLRFTDRLASDLKTRY